MNQQSADDAAPPLWQVVPIEQYVVPGNVQMNWVRKNRRFLSRLFRTERNETPSRAQAEKELRALPGIRLEHLVPSIDWAPAARALERAMGDLGPSRHHAPAVCLFIGQPHCAHAEIVKHWAANHNASTLPAPPRETIIAGDDRWMEELGRGQELWVVPELERWFLRHEHGLSLVRRFLDRALTGNLGRGMIGCDSWSWAYLQRVLAIAGVPTLTLQAFDGCRLARYFFQVTCGTVESRLRVCSVRTGESVLPDESALAGGHFEASVELRHLAAHCRGNLGIAWKYWRTRLRAEGEAESAPRGAGTDKVIWLADDITEPILPAESGEESVFILHALLLHHGSTAEGLSEVLPMLRGQIVSSLLQLESLGLVESCDGWWRIAALGYASVRELLHERQYLIDPF